MRLRYSPLSPFARKVRVFAAETGLAERLELVPCDVWAPGSDIVRDNPLGKVPVLLTGDGLFVGSALCCEYLDTLHSGSHLIPRAGSGRWLTLQLNALADGIMEAAVAHVTERLRRPERFVWQGWLDRQEAKIKRTLDAIGTEFGAPAGRIDIAAITLACALSYLEIRLPQLGWRHDHRRLAEWHADFAARPSMAATQPPAEQP